MGRTGRRIKKAKKRGEILTKHHKIPTSRGGISIPENIKHVCAAKHRAWHLLFRNMTPEEIIEHIRMEWM